MAKVNASLADVKTTFEPAPPDRYRLKVKAIEEKLSPAEGDPTLERQNFNVELVIDDGGEHQGKPIYHNISLHTKKGETNRAGMADLKRLFMACLGLDEEDEFFSDPDNLDTDLLLNQNLECDVYIDRWEKDGRKGMSNKLTSSSMTVVS